MGLRRFRKINFEPCFVMQKYCFSGVKLVTDATRALASKGNRQNTEAV